MLIMAETSSGLESGVDYPGTCQEFREWFPDEQSCLDYLVREPQRYLAAFLHRYMAERSTLTQIRE